MNRKFIFALVASFAILAAGCGKEDTVPSDGGQKSEQLSENSKIKSAVEALAGEASTVSPMLSGIEVWQDGYLASGAWFRNSTKDTRHQMWSVTKTFTGIAIGMAVSEGKLSLDDKVADLFPDEVALAKKSETSEGKMMTAEEISHLEALTVRNLLTMTDGHITDPTIEYGKAYLPSLLAGWNKYVTSSGVNATAILDDKNTTIADLFFQHPFKAAPGTTFQYDTFASCLLSEIIFKKTGEDLGTYLYTRLFKPLGLNQPAWDTVQGTSAGGWGLHLTTDEMTAFGRLLVQGGKYDGKQIIPADYLKEALSSHILTYMNSGTNYVTDGYGYQIRTRKDGTLYMAVGLFGQYIIMIPEKKAVIAVTSDYELNVVTLAAMASGGDYSDTPAMDLVWKHIIPVL